MDTAIRVPDGAAADSEARSVALAGLVVACLATTAGAAILAYAGAEHQPGLNALVRALSAATPMAIGAYAWHRGWESRFSLVLIATGACWAMTALAETDDSLAYTVGRVAGWVVEFLMVYLVLSFPSGRLHEPVDRFLASAMGAVVVVFFGLQLFVAETFQVPSPFTSCTENCPANAMFALQSEPAFLDSVMRPLGAVLVLAVMTGVVLRLYQRLHDSTPLTRRMLMPVLVIAMIRAGALGIAIVGRELEPNAWAFQLAAWLLAIAIPAIALAFLASLLRWRLFAATALQRIAESLRTHPDSGALRQAFAEAFDDPTVEIAFPAGGGEDQWMNYRGDPLPMPQPSKGRAVSEVREDGRLVAAIVYDAGLGARPDLVTAGVSMAAVVLENQRLTAEAKASLRELQLSRARLAAGAERERRRIERDLHDGAQQRLVALKIELELAETLVQTDAAEGAAHLRRLAQDLDEALEELRALAHGIYPPLLADRGLEDAVLSVTSRFPVRVDLDTNDLGRFSTEIEGAVYFCLLEALQNVLKHARQADKVALTIRRTSADLQFSVRDNGPGMAGIEVGAGITNMRDRLAALGGDLKVSCATGAGTQVSGRVPIGRRPASSGGAW